jgi:hypothetical protein
MKQDWSEVEKWRVQNSNRPETRAGDHWGCFEIPTNDRKDRERTKFYVIAVDGQMFGWEHVSVSVHYRKGFEEKKRTPTWAEMCYIKDLFWEKDECVVQYHPKEEDYVNYHPHVLHLWKKVIGEEFPVPPKICV